MMRDAEVRFFGFVRFAILICAAWAILAFAPSGISLSTPAFATETQCAIPANSCGCATCGCGGGYGVPSCPAGQVLYDDYCVPGCPAGYTRYPGLPGLCIPPCHHGCPDGYDQVPLPECPQGYHRDLRNPDNCLRDPDVNNGQCPDSMAFSYETGQCEFTCPRGFYLNENHVCESYYTRECPPNYTRNPETGKCMPPGNWPAQYNWVCLPHCPPGTFRDIREPTRCIPPPPTCSQGYENVQGRCLPVCPPNVSRDAYGYCNPPRCPDGNYTNLRGQCVPAGCPQGSEDVRGQCMPICKQGLTRTYAGECVPPQKTCPDGQRLDPKTNLCWRIPPTTNKQPNPPAKPTPQVPLTCKQGWHLDGNGRCAPPKVNVPKGCPDGTEFDRRTKRCRPIGNDNAGDNGNYNPYDQPDQNLEPNLPRFNPNVLQQLLPKGGGANTQGGGKFNAADCPDGQYRDKNNRCVEP